MRIDGRDICAAPLLEAEMRREMQPGRQIRPGRQMHSQIPSRMQSQTPSQIPSQVSSRATSSRLAERSGARGETNAGASRTPAPSRKPGTADSRVTFTPAGGTRDGARDVAERMVTRKVHSGHLASALPGVSLSKRYKY